MSRHHRFVIRVATSLCVAIIFCVPPTSAQTYTVTDLGALGGAGSAATAINDAAQVVGYSPLTPAGSYLRPFLWEAGTMINLGSLSPNGDGLAYGINNNGQVTGWSEAGPTPHAFIWENGQMMDLGTPWGAESYAEDINDAGQITGVNSSGAFLWQDGNWTSLGTLPGSNGSWGFAISNNAEIVGSAYSPGAHAFLWAQGHITDLGMLPGYSTSVALAINDVGQRGGFSGVAIPSVTHACIWEADGSITDLGLEVHSRVYGMNNQGDAVGYYSPDSKDVHFRAFVWQDGVATDLNELIPPDSGWTLKEATDINNGGQIVGVGWNPAGQGRAFLLTPVGLGDINGDGSVNAFDLALLLGAWGTCNPSCEADLNNDGTVNPIDLAQLLGNWG